MSLGFQFIAVAAVVAAAVISVVCLFTDQVLLGMVGLLMTSAASIGVGWQTQHRIKRFRATQ